MLKLPTIPWPESALKAFAKLSATEILHFMVVFETIEAISWCLLHEITPPEPDMNLD